MIAQGLVPAMDYTKHPNYTEGVIEKLAREDIIKEIESEKKKI